MTLIDKYY